MQLLAVSTLVFLAFQGPVQAAISCTTTAECAWGETCVAGDADTSIQACVPATVCGGSSTGNCPSDHDSGKLACLWRPYDDCSAGCAMMDGKKGIYKCVSLTRCDAYYGDASCSDGCSVNGVRCNGQGSCNMMSTKADGTPSFGCTCDNGYSGPKCEVAPGSTASNSSATDEDSFWGALDSADDSADGSDDSSVDGSQDSSTDASGDSSTDTSEDSSTNASEDSSTDTSDDSSTDASGDSSTDGSEVSSSDNAEDSSVSSSSDESSSGSSPTAAAESVSSSSSSGIRPGVLILVLVMAAFFLIGTVLLVAYSRRRKQQEQEEYANALASTHGVGAVGAVDAADGHTGRTPRHVIATM
ncbi:hypothetical protein PRIC1_010067 [Phytophthora ramorum]